ncbi:ATP-dependent DNA helicase [Frankliniella fusca]|uniref:ATP-dependent DNA helicase n=1 Tax=Frankliniella fusca TaxID=407009 RepID=A0AAE1I2W4_9NEOP|nr:ATP-dependent DNA helicase [Frankliniella fusca]
MSICGTLEWIDASGNCQLLLIDPIHIRKKYFVCGAHFERSCFSSAKRLKVNVVPTLHIQRFENQCLILDYEKNLNEWKDDVDKEINFVSDSSIANTFEESMRALRWSICPKCKEKRLLDCRISANCAHRANCWQYSELNDMDPGNVPEELQDLTYIEEQLIARVHPLISIFKLKGLQFGYRGHVINFEQNVNEIARQLPHKVTDLSSVMAIRYSGTNIDKYHDFFVRGGKVKKALLYLKENNPYYADIEISDDNITSLPEDGSVAHEIVTIDLSPDASDSSNESIEECIDGDVNNISESFVLNGGNVYQNDQVNNRLKWPSLNGKIDEFHTPGYMVCAFPTLYPQGKADYYSERRKSVGASNYFKHLLLFHDNRFAKHATFRYFAMNTWMRWSALNDGNIFVRNNEQFKNVTAGQLKQMIEEDPNLLKKIMFQASNLRGTKAYWHCKAGELKDMVEQLGLPTVFLTFSCADHHWADLFRLLTDKDDVSDLTESDRKKLIQQNPHILSMFFNARVEAFIEKVLKVKYKVKDYWYRVEYQHSQLLLKVQRHSKCSTDYCLRVNKKTKQKQCRFKFPVNLQDKATIVKNSGGEFEFKPERNDPLLNKFNKFLILLWRANIDIAPVLSEKALIGYLTKYVSKSETPSKTLTEILANIMLQVEAESRAKTVIQKLFTNAVADRDISAQEVCHTLLSLPFCSAGGRKFVIVNTSEKKWVMVPEEEFQDGNQKYGQSFVEKYRERPENMENVCLWDAAKCYNYRAGTWSVIKGKENIVRVFPQYTNQKCDEEGKERFYKQQVLLHVPWRYEEHLKDDCQSWKNVYEGHRINERSNAVYQLGNECEEDDFESAEDDVHDNDFEEEFMLLSRLGPNSNAPSIELGRREVDLNHDWRQSSAMYEHLGSVQEFQSFIESAKEKDSNNEPVNDIALPQVNLSPDQERVINIVKEIIENIKCTNSYVARRIIVQGKAGTGKSLVIKYLTSILQKELGNASYFLGAPTGVAAILINGQTLHNIFKLGVDSNAFKPLTGESAKDLSNSFENVKFLILDEWSMIGCKTLAMIEARCREATGINEEFGGLTVILFGDGRQLPPVKDNALCSKIQGTVLGQRGCYIIKNFDTKIVLNTCHRQQNEEFLKVLDNLSNGEISISDYNLLATRFTYRLSDEEIRLFNDAIRLFATKEEVREFNINVLSNLRDCTTNVPVPVARIVGKHNCAAAKTASFDQAGSLEKVFYLAKGCQIMLRHNLWTSRGLVNGAVGKVHDILYDCTDDDFPCVILCDFPLYTGPAFIPGTKIVPIRPMLKSFALKEEKCTRYQFPITLCYAMSIHKAQGMTLDKVVVNIGDKEFALGLAYVGLTRARCLNDIIISPFVYDRMKLVNNHKSLAQRKEFDKWLCGEH